MDRFEIEELICKVFNIDEDNEDIEEKLYEYFQNECSDSFQEFSQHLIKSLAPMVQVASSPLTNTTYKGFGTEETAPNGKKFVNMICQIEIEEE